VHYLARTTVGMTGAQLANLVNLSAVKAASHGFVRVNMKLIDESFDDIIMGT
jgi:ATP-dependent Zn protease